MRLIRFGLIGGGLMGREFASAAARWCHLKDMETGPQLVAVCDASTAASAWFKDHIPTLGQITSDYRSLLANPEVEAVYIAVPHNLHQEIYVAAIEAGKHLMGEKPFGIDMAANRAIQIALERHPECFARCSSEYPFYPAMQRMGRMIEKGDFGTILEVNTGFLHSSDLDPNKPINWKRTVSLNGEYGCLGDLGMHPLHIPLRSGWKPRNVRALLTRAYAHRPGKNGSPVPCETWDNATLLCESYDPRSGAVFPLTVKTQRIAPGEKNSWYCEILGTRHSARFSTKQPNTLHFLNYTIGAEQTWQSLEMGHEMSFPTVTGGIFEAGFSDIILQMWASFIEELVRRRTRGMFAGCITPQETYWQHQVLSAALKSHYTASVVEIES